MEQVVVAGPVWVQRITFTGRKSFCGSRLFKCEPKIPACIPEDVEVEFEECDQGPRSEPGDILLVEVDSDPGPFQCEYVEDLFGTPEGLPFLVLDTCPKCKADHWRALIVAWPPLCGTCGAP